MEKGFTFVGWKIRCRRDASFPPARTGTPASRCAAADNTLSGVLGAGAPGQRPRRLREHKDAESSFKTPFTATAIGRDTGKASGPQSTAESRNRSRQAHAPDFRHRSRDATTATEPLDNRVTLRQNRLRHKLHTFHKNELKTQHRRKPKTRRHKLPEMESTNLGDEFSDTPEAQSM